MDLYFPANDSSRHYPDLDTRQRDLLNWLAVRAGGTYAEDEKIGKAFLKLVGGPMKSPVTTKPGSDHIKLNVPFYDQKDSTTGHAARMCFSSCCAMMLKYMKPGTLTESANADDDYLRRLMLLGGDSVNHGDQVQTLGFFGIQAGFYRNCNWETMEHQLRRNIPVPCGLLHHGPANAPTGGGHFVLAYGLDEKNVYCHDPYGEIDLVHGGWARVGIGVGKGVVYSRTNFGKRWMVGGGSTGWAMVAEPVKTKSKT